MLVILYTMGQICSSYDTIEIKKKKTITYPDGKVEKIDEVTLKKQANSHCNTTISVESID